MGTMKIIDRTKFLNLVGSKYDFNITEFCKESGISLDTYKSIIKAPSRRVQLATFVAICNALNAKPEELAVSEMKS